MHAHDFLHYARAIATVIFGVAFLAMASAGLLFLLAAPFVPRNKTARPREWRWSSEPPGDDAIPHSRYAAKE